MNNNTLEFNNPVTINEAYKLLRANGDKITYLFRGEPGRNMFARRLRQGLMSTISHRGSPSSSPSA